MTPQEFFKKDLFAENAGVVLLEVREGYSKAKLEIKPEHLNAGARATLSMPRHANGISAEAPAAIK